MDASRQGGEPGTLYVMEADEEDVAAGIEDGEMIDPHGMDPQTVLRFVRAVGGWPGKVIVIACEPGEIEEPGIGLTPPVAAAVERRRRPRAARRSAELQSRRRRYAELTDRMHELSLAPRVVDTAMRHADGPAR